ncbi:hypothetical protein ACHQM5_005359 [Ranunculus cassubicifolius]
MDKFWDSGVVFESRLSDGFGENYSSLVLDSERVELVRAPGKLGKKTGKTEAKAIAALKNHSEAERRRRERINSHLNMFRSLVPSTDKMDKASLLAEVIKHVKELKRSTTDACEGYIIPMDIDEVTVEPHEEKEKGLFCIKASLCCEDRPEIFTDLRQALDTFNLKTVKAEMSTLGGRMKNVFVLAGFNVDNIDDVEVRRLLMNSVHQTLTSILDKYSAPTELSPSAFLPNKRRRFSVFDSSSSSS